MSFAVFSKDFTANMYTTVENRFVTQYLPLANGDAVRVYLYGLYLCQCNEPFDAAALARILKLPEQTVTSLFGFWEDCDLVHILSKDPLMVEYLPVSSAVGKPKKVKPEKYAGFNRELLKLLQQTGKDFKPYEWQRILEFLENNPMEQDAFLLLAQSCAQKDPETFTSAHLINKAKQFVRDGKYTYGQVEESLSGFHRHEKDLGRLFELLSLYRKPREEDYAYLDKWLDAGIELSTVFCCAELIDKKTLTALDSLLTELAAHGIRTEKEARAYIERRALITETVYKVARKLGIKVQNPSAYREEYAEKWFERGYDAESLTALAAVGLKMGYGFPELDSMIGTLYRSGIVDSESVNGYCNARNAELRLLQRIQTECGVVKKTQAVLDMLSAWKGWNFSDEMILEAARRSAGASAPLAYMNKLLSEWKRLGAYTVSDIPERESAKSETYRAKPDYRSEAAIAADLKSEREHFYAVRRSRALAAAERAKKKAEEDPEFRAAESEIKRKEIELARAEVYDAAAVPAIQEALTRAYVARGNALIRLKLSDSDFTPRFACAKCSDTGFLPDGRMCDCFKRK